MSIGLVFWVLMLLWLVLGFFWYKQEPGTRWAVGGGFLLWFLLFLLGWAVFGFPIQGPGAPMR